MSDMTARIDSKLSEQHKKRADLLRATGLSEGCIRNWIKGSIPSVDAAFKVADFLNVSIEWLIFGKDGNSEKLSNDEAEIIQLYRILDERDKIDLMDMAKVKASHYSNTMGKNIITG